MLLGEHGSQPWTGNPEGQREMKAEPAGEEKRGLRPERERTSRGENPRLKRGLTLQRGVD